MENEELHESVISSKQFYNFLDKNELKNQENSYKS